MSLYKAILLIACVVALPQSFAAVKVAAVLRLDESYSKFPTDMLKSMHFAQNYLRSEKKIVLKSFSHDGSPEGLSAAVENVKKFNPDIVVAGETSQYAMTLARAFKNKIFITPTASSVMLDEIHPFPVRMVHVDPQYIEVVKYVLNNQDVKKIGVFQNISHPNTKVISEAVVKFLRDRGTNSILVQYATGEEINKASLQPFIDNKIDMLVVFSFESDLRKIYSVLSQRDIYPIYVGGDSWGRDETLKANLLKGGGKLFTGVRNLYWNPSRKDDFFVKTVTELKKVLGGREPDAFHAIGFDTMKLIIDVVNLSNGTSNYKSTIRNNSFRNFLSTESFRFDDRLYPVKDFHLFLIKNGKINPISDR